MEARINKPRAFLSHSKLDTEFIDKLANDLRRCQIEPWLDTEEIRDGKPWLKIIFEDGIPTCDVVIVYLTDNSINSKMVEKEIDAAIIEQLAEKGISLLPYVNNASLRSKIRGDVRALQCREWNPDNYSDVLASVVAEIWRSYMERTVKTATLQETNKRLELELKLRQLQEKTGDSIFTESENIDFRYIYSKLSRKINVIVRVHEESENKGPTPLIGQDVFETPILFLLKLLLEDHFDNLNQQKLATKLREMIIAFRSGQPKNKARFMNPFIDMSFAVELRQYGITKFIREEERHNTFGLIVNNRDLFTEKLYRFFYWLDYGSHPIEGIQHIGFEEAPPPAVENTPK
jgi:hypothetical protein